MKPIADKTTVDGLTQALNASSTPATRLNMTTDGSLDLDPADEEMDRNINALLAHLKDHPEDKAVVRQIVNRLFGPADGQKGDN